MRSNVSEVEMESEDDFLEVEEGTVEGQIEVIKFQLIGKTMLLMNSNAGVNPLNPLVKQKGIITSIRPKNRTDEDIMELYRLDFVLGMYYEEDIGPYVPGVNIEAAILAAAQQERMGPRFKAGVSVVEDKIPLQYKGPRDIQKLWDAREKGFADIRPTKLKASSSLMKCRPCFNKWSLSGTVSYNGAIVDHASVKRCIAKVGDIGICDYRKRYGKSTVEFN